jgi:hypothetical protein
MPTDSGVASCQTTDSTTSGVSSVSVSGAAIGFAGADEPEPPPQEASRVKKSIKNSDLMRVLNILHVSSTYYYFYIFKSSDSNAKNLSAKLPPMTGEARLGF